MAMNLHAQRFVFAAPFFAFDIHFHAINLSRLHQVPTDACMLVRCIVSSSTSELHTFLSQF